MKHKQKNIVVVSPPNITSYYIQYAHVDPAKFSEILALGNQVNKYS